MRSALLYTWLSTAFKISTQESAISAFIPEVTITGPQMK
jgi:hypothetical protein